MGTNSLSFVKAGATSRIKTIYRGNTLYYTLSLNGINDLTDHYLPGVLTIDFIDEYGFTLQSEKVATNELVTVMNDQKQNFLPYIQRKGRYEP
jgi:hypothetical protein